MPAIIALLVFFSGALAAAEVALVGVIGDKAAVLAIDGGDPKAVKVGQSWNGISVIAVEKNRATSGQTTLAAGPGGHFFGDGAVNGMPIRFLVDTGASAIALPASDAQRLGIDYRKGQPGVASTANGSIAVYRVRLDSVRVGEIELHQVDAVVIERGLETALLGMSFLNRVEMKREGSTMTLTRRF